MPLYRHVSDRRDHRYGCGQCPHSTGCQRSHYIMLFQDQLQGTDLSGNVIFLDKPIKVAELAQSIDHALEIMAKAVPLIELREDEDTIYVTEPDILYAEAEGRNVIVTLKDGRTVKVATTAINLFSQIENHPTFFAPTVRAILNGRYMEKLGFRKVIMCDGKSSRCTETALLTQTAFGRVSCVT